MQALLPILLLTAAASAQDEALGPMAAQLRSRVGEWCVEASLQLTPQARTVTIAATAESHLVGGRWLVTEMRGPGFQGLGVNGYDPARRLYSGYWIDGTRGFTIPVEGRYDPGTATFTTRSIERRADGESVEVTSVTRPNGPDEEETVFTAPDEHGRPYQRMALRFRRTVTGSDCPRQPDMAG